MSRSIPAYLDYCASAPLRPEVAAVMGRAMAGTGNASSVHSFGRAQHKVVDEARESIARALGVKPGQVIFTAGATEANNTALHAFAGVAKIVSAIEHPSILQSAPDAKQIHVTGEGIIDLNHLEELLKASPKGTLVSLMLVNNETGIIQPVKEAAAMCRRFGAYLHCDAVQAAGRMSFTMADLDAGMLSLSAHKIGGPQGAGALVIREKIPFQPLMLGGGQELRRRAGTENVAGIAGFARALELSAADVSRSAEWKSWRDDFENRILSEAPDAMVFGKNVPRVATVSCLSMPGVTNETQLMAFDLAGYAVSSGSACSSGKVQASHVLKAMGAAEPVAKGTLRVSFGWASEPSELADFAGEWLSLYRRQSSRAAA